MSRRPSRNRGFTLVELMVLVGIVGLVAAIAVPSFNGYLRSNRVATTADQIIADMALARALAVSQGFVFRFEGNANGYAITDPSNSRTIHSREFEGSVSLTANINVNFYPWGAADSVTLTLDNGSQTRSIIVLPTGLAEVQ